MAAQAALFDEATETTATPGGNLPPPGACVRVHETGFGGREVTGTVLADPDTGELMTREGGGGITLAAVEEEDGRTTWVAWVADRPDLVTYDVAGGEVPEVRPEVVEVATPPPAPARRKRKDPPPLTEDDLTRETGIRGKIDWQRPEPEARRDAQEAPQAPAGVGWEDRVQASLLRAQKAAGAAQRREDEAMKAYHEAQREYMRAEEGSGAEAKAFAVVQERLSEVTRAQERVAEIKREVRGTMTGEVAAQVPAWVWPAVLVAAVLVAGPLGLLGAAVLVWSPIKALLTGK